MERILVPAKDGSQIPLVQLADIDYVRGPQVIKTEGTYLTGYVLFDMKPGNAEVDVVEACQRFLAEKRASGEFSRHTTRMSSIAVIDRPGRAGPPRLMR